MTQHCKKCRSKEGTSFKRLKLAVSQINEEYEAKKVMKRYLGQRERSWATLKKSVIQILRGENSRADALSKLASSATPNLEKIVYVERLARPNTQEVMEIDTTPCRMAPSITFLQDNILPKGKEEARDVEQCFQKFLWDGEMLPRKAFAKTDIYPYLRCPEKAEYMM